MIELEDSCLIFESALMYISSYSCQVNKTVCVICRIKSKVKKGIKQIITSFQFLCIKYLGEIGFCYPILLDSHHFDPFVGLLVYCRLKWHKSIFWTVETFEVTWNLMILKNPNWVAWKCGSRSDFSLIIFNATSVWMQITFFLILKSLMCNS